MREYFQQQIDQAGARYVEGKSFMFIFMTYNEHGNLTLKWAVAPKYEELKDNYEFEGYHPVSTKLPIFKLKD